MNKQFLERAIKNIENSLCNVKASNLFEFEFMLKAYKQRLNDFDEEKYERLSKRADLIKSFESEARIYMCKGLLSKEKLEKFTDLWNSYTEKLLKEYQGEI